MKNINLQNGRVLPTGLLWWTAVRASGPGGQHVNRTASRVVLRFDASKADLSLSERERLARVAGRRMDAAGRILLTSQATRSQARNLAETKTRLVRLVERALEVPVVRTASAPPPSAEIRRLQAKRRQANKKLLRTGRLEYA